jgi:hypothetical protein
MSAKTSIGFKANAESDQDLIAWWEALPAGERSQALRDLIRRAIRKPISQPNGNEQAPIMEQVATDTAWLRSAFMELPTYLEGLMSRMPAARAEVQAVSAEGQPAEQPRLEQAAVDRRRANVKRNTW